VLDLLQDPELVKQAQEEHQKRLRGKEYRKDPTVEAPLERAKELAEFYTGKKIEQEPSHFFHRFPTERKKIDPGNIQIPCC